MTPMMWESLELALCVVGLESPEHIAAHAHERGASDCERGCSATFHLCGCHGNHSPSMAAADPIDPSGHLPLPAAARGRAGEPPPIRPPKA